MARIAGPQKIEKIKRATMEMMVETGYKGLTVSKIAKNAGVSVGYLYRHYDGKIELIQELIGFYFETFRNQLVDSMEQAASIRQVVELLVTKVIQIAKEDPTVVRFLASLTHDQQFHTDKTGGSMEGDIIQFIELIKERGTQTKEVGEQIQRIDLFLMLIQYPLDYVDLKMAGEFCSRPLEDKDVERITNIICNALK